jgi:hypothetical protein
MTNTPFFLKRKMKKNKKNKKRKTKKKESQA